MPRVRPVHRSSIYSILVEWQHQKITAEAVQSWAEARFNSDEYEPDDWEKEGSIANEVLALLEMLDFHLITEEDIPALLDFLKTEKGNFALGFKRWQQYFRSIDLNRRASELANRPPYAPFCT